MATKARRVMVLVELESDESLVRLRQMLDRVLSGLNLWIRRVVQIQLNVIREPEPKRQLRRAHRRREP